MESKDILIVDDDENMNFALCETLKRSNFSYDTAFSFLEAKERLHFQNYPLVITDVRMPDGNGIQLVADIKKTSPDSRIIVITAFGKVEDAVKALKNGAEDYIQKPFSAEKLLKLVEKYFPANFRQHPAATFLTENQAMTELLKKAEKAAPSMAPVLITGESGVGKEVFARFIHEKSGRNQFPYLAINCAAIPENLLESELFGYEKGAFTGADKFKPGKFELADGGTLVLDEIGDMPLNLQAKILRVLQEKEIDRLGSNQTISVNTRIISLTNQSIDHKITEAKFRQDLFFRLNVIEFHIPPLRERKEDIAMLTNHFLIQYASQNNMDPIQISSAAVRILLNHSWPGNIRELQNVIQRALIFCSGNEISAEDIEFKTISSPLPGTNQLKTVADMEKELILATLAKVQNNKKKAADILGISSRTLRNKLHEYNLDLDSEQ